MTDSRWKKLFDEFDAANPHVWQLFKRFTLQAISKGKKNYSTRSIIERIRWHTDIETHDETYTGDFKLNENFTTYYGRKFMELFPQYDGFFKLRTLRS